jgi:hypothetical protein
MQREEEEEEKPFKYERISSSLLDCNYHQP